MNEINDDLTMREAIEKLMLKGKPFHMKGGAGNTRVLCLQNPGLYLDKIPVGEAEIEFVYDYASGCWTARKVRFDSVEQEITCTDARFVLASWLNACASFSQPSAA
jgi:hypothetical protein